MNIRNFAPDKDIIIIQTVDGDIKIERQADGTIQLYRRPWIPFGQRTDEVGWRKDTFLYPKKPHPRIGGSARASSLSRPDHGREVLGCPECDPGSPCVNHS